MKLRILSAVFVVAGLCVVANLVADHHEVDWDEIKCPVSGKKVNADEKVDWADYDWLRPPETGAVMVRGRAGGTGVPFNLGEMTVTRCALRLAGGQEGHAYVAGRSRQKAGIAALCDALMQDPEQAGAVRDRVLIPLAETAAEARDALAAKAAATRVEFFTMSRERGGGA